MLPSTPLAEVHMLFITLRLQEVLVSSQGRLAGIITREKDEARHRRKTTLCAHTKTATAIQAQILPLKKNTF